MKKKNSYVLAFNGSSLTLWTLLGLGRDIIRDLLFFKSLNIKVFRLKFFGILEA